MSESGFDAVVGGAGHNGLVLATYLQQAGLRTVLVEQAATVGGMATTTAPLGPGLRHNPHANYLSYQDIMPMLAEFDLARHGLRTISPHAQHGIAFDDGRPPVVLYRPACMEQTHRSIGRYSRQDADLFTALTARAATLTDALARALYRPVDASTLDDHAEAVERAYRDLGITSRLGTRSAAAMIDELFDTPELRALLQLLVIEFGGSLDEPGGDMALLGFTLWLCGRRSLAVGGTQSISDALYAAATDAGVTVWPSSRATRFVVENGRVTGVRTTTRDITGVKVVASSVDIGQTLLELLPPTALTARDRAAAVDLGRQRVPVVASQAFALRSPPAYTSARHAPDLDRCMQVYIGYDGPSDVREHERELAAGLLPAPAASVRVNTLWDPTQGNGALHVGGADSFFPHGLSESEWDAVAVSYNEALLATWARVAPNMTRNNVVDDHFHRPPRSDRGIWARTGPDCYRTDIHGLYLCGTGTYPGGGVHGACAHNAFHIIATDLGNTGDDVYCASRKDHRDEAFSGHFDHSATVDKCVLHG